MTAELREELAQSLDQAQWDWLMPHAKRDVVIVVSPNLNLLDVGVAIANDNATLVQSWIGTQQVRKPSTDELNAWNKNPDKRFNTLIVQPYVVVQERVEETTPS